LDIGIINMRFKYLDMDTVSDVKYPDSDTDISEPFKWIRSRIRSENIRTVFIPVHRRTSMRGRCANAAVACGMRGGAYRRCSRMSMRTGTSMRRLATRNPNGLDVAYASVIDYLYLYIVL